MLNKKHTLTLDEINIQIKILTDKLSIVNQQFNCHTQPELIQSSIFELKSLELKILYFKKMASEILESNSKKGCE